MMYRYTRTPAWFCIYKTIKYDDVGFFCQYEFLMTIALTTMILHRLLPLMTLIKFRVHFQLIRLDRPPCVIWRSLGGLGPRFLSRRSLESLRQR